MKSLKELLSLSAIPGAALSRTRHVCAEILSNKFAITITPKQIDYNEGILTVRAAPVVKAEIHLHHKELVAQLAREGINVTAIR